MSVLLRDLALEELTRDWAASHSGEGGKNGDENLGLHGCRYDRLVCRLNF